MHISKIIFNNKLMGEFVVVSLKAIVKLCLLDRNLISGAVHSKKRQTIIKMSQENVNKGM